MVLVLLFFQPTKSKVLQKNHVIDAMEIGSYFEREGLDLLGIRANLIPKYLHDDE